MQIHKVKKVVLERFLANYVLDLWFFIDLRVKREKNEPFLGYEKPFGQLSHWFRHFITYFGGGSDISQGCSVKYFGPSVI